MPLNSKLKGGLKIGCAVLFIGVMLLFGGTVYFAKQMGKEYKAVKELEQQLVQTHGKSGELPAGFTGLPDKEQVEAFLAVRRAAGEWRQLVESSFAEVTAEEGWNRGSGLGKFLRTLKASRDLAPVFSGFWNARNQALLEQEMGMGPYIYLYCLVYYSWLEIDPADGALDAEAFLSGMGATGPSPDQGATAADQGKRQIWARRQVNTLMLPLLQRAARHAANESAPEARQWADLLQQEIRELQDDPWRVPFPQGLPEPVAGMLEPWRQDLTAVYLPAVNPVELIFEDTWQQKESP